MAKTARKPTTKKATPAPRVRRIKKLNFNFSGRIQKIKEKCQNWIESRSCFPLLLDFLDSTREIKI